jgi:hypothetical protein
MSRHARKREVALASARYAQARGEFEARMTVLRGRVGALPMAWLLGGGFASGLAAGVLPLRALARAGGFTVEMLTLAMRTPHAHQLVSAMRKGWNSAGRRSGGPPGAPAS